MVQLDLFGLTIGKNLEHTGVVRLETLLPTAQDIANNRDPVLAHAAELLGVKRRSSRRNGERLMTDKAK